MILGLSFWVIQFVNVWNRFIDVRFDSSCFAKSDF